MASSEEDNESDVIVLKSKKVVSPSVIAPHTYMVLTDVVAENSGGSHGELSSAGRDAYEYLQIAMKSVCIVYDVPCQGLL